MIPSKFKEAELLNHKTKGILDVYKKTRRTLHELKTYNRQYILHLGDIDEHNEFFNKGRIQILSYFHKSILEITIEFLEL